MTEQTYTVTLVDTVHYSAHVTAADTHAAMTQARQLWRDDFLRFTPIDDGSIEIIAVAPVQDAPASAAGGGR